MLWVFLGPSDKQRLLTEEDQPELCPWPRAAGAVDAGLPAGLRELGPPPFSVPPNREA